MRALQNIDPKDAQPPVAPGVRQEVDNVQRLASGRRKANAFTLVELLVSMTVLVLLVGLLGQLSIRTTSVWTSGESNKERLQSLRAISDSVGAELQAALLPINRAAATNNLPNFQLVVNPALPATYLNRDAIFWQAPVAADTTYGDVAEVGYFVKWDTSNANNPRAQLCRFFVNPTDPSGAVASPAPSPAPPPYLVYNSSTSTPWLTDSILEQGCPANQANIYQGLFAENVIGLWTKCLDPLGNQIGAAGVDQFDSRSGYTYTYKDSNISPPVVGVTITKAGCALPAAVQIGFVILDSYSASRVGTTQQAAIMKDVTNSADAPTCEQTIQADTSLGAVRQGIRSYQTTIFLQNGK